MKKSLIALALVGAFAAPAFAEEAAPAPIHSFTANVGVVTDYVFRGISQSQHKPALQGGVDYAHVSGLYAGVWASTIEWVDRGTNSLVYKDGNNFEIDLYGGYKGAIGDISYDVGMIRYYYDGNFGKGNVGVTPDTTEAYVGFGWKMLSFKYSNVVSNNFVGWGGTDSSTRSKGSEYFDLTVTYPVNETVNVIGHVGHQYVKNSPVATYNDWKLGVTKDYGFGVVGLTYTGTNADHSQNEIDYLWNNKNVGKDVLALSFTKSF